MYHHALDDTLKVAINYWNFVVIEHYKIHHNNYSFPTYNYEQKDGPRIVSAASLLWLHLCSNQNTADGIHNSIKCHNNATMQFDYSWVYRRPTVACIPIASTNPNLYLAHCVDKHTSKHQLQISIKRYGKVIMHIVTRN